MHTERQRVIQRELDERSRKLYNMFFRPLFESLCNEQVYFSLVEQLVSMSLISEADKEILLSSIQHPKVRASSLLEVLNIEEKPRLLMELIKAMEEVDNLKGLADEMLAQYKANEESTIKCPEGDEYLLLPPRSAPEAALPVPTPQAAPLAQGLVPSYLPRTTMLLQMPLRRVGTQKGISINCMDL